MLTEFQIPARHLSNMHILHVYNLNIIFELLYLIGCKFTNIIHEVSNQAPRLGIGIQV